MFSTLNQNLPVVPYTKDLGQNNKQYKKSACYIVFTFLQVLLKYFPQKTLDLFECNI